MPDMSLRSSNPIRGVGLRAAEKKAAVALSEVAARIENPGTEKGSELGDRAVKVMEAIKGDLGRVRRLRSENLKKLLGWTKLAEEDSERLLAGALTKKNAELQNKDERIFEVKAPEHLLRVLRTEETRNVCLIHVSIGELGCQDKDLALGVGRGSQATGTHRVTGVWEVGPMGANPKEDGAREFRDPLRSLKSVGEKSAWMTDYIIDAALLAIKEDEKLGGFIETAEGDLAAPLMLAFGIDQGSKTRQIAGERFRNLFSAFPKKTRLSGVWRTREAIAAFCAPPGRELEGLAASPSQSAEDMSPRIESEVQKRKKEGSAGYCSSCRAEEERLPLKPKAPRPGSLKGPGGGVLPHLATKDWKRAYFQVGVDVPESNPVEAWGNESNLWRCILACVLSMGNPHPAPSWRRIAEFTMFMVEEWLWRPCLAHTDDSTLVSVEEYTEDRASLFGAPPKGVGPCPLTTGRIEYARAIDEGARNPRLNF